MKFVKRTVFAIAVAVLICLGVVYAPGLYKWITLDRPGAQTIPATTGVVCRVNPLEDNPADIRLSPDQASSVVELLSSKPTFVPQGLHLALGELQLDDGREYLIFNDGSVGVTNRSICWKSNQVSSYLSHAMTESRKKQRAAGPIK